MLPTWMRRALFATAAMNILVSPVFLFPAARSLRALAGFPEVGHPIYAATVGMFVLTFGLAYLWLAVTGDPNRLFITVAAFGKLWFVALLVGFWVAGSLPLRAPLSAGGDLIFGVLFATWLLR